MQLSVILSQDIGTQVEFMKPEHIRRSITDKNIPRLDLEITYAF